MNKTKIEWVRNEDGSQGFTINPVKGLCPMDCKDNQGKSYCYARRLYKRFKWGEEIRWDDSVYWNPLTGKQGDKYFVGSTIELFGEWIEDWWMSTIFKWVRAYPQRTFIFLTKQPQNLKQWSPFPDNCWIGVSVTSQEQLRPAIWKLSDIQCNKRFLSLEPLLENILDQVLPAEWDDMIDWAIVGQQTPVSKSTLPKLKWIARIEASCKVANIPLFMKNNLKSLLGNALRQEFPK